MWWEMLKQAAANGNATFNTALAGSMSGKNGQDFKLGSQLTQGAAKAKQPYDSEGEGEGARGVEAMAGGAGTVNARSTGGYSKGGYSSDDRIKEPTQQKDLLSEVADMIHNYTYHYKPGMGEDPSIEYSGPMAQDLLQVDGYRACVFEDENGLLKVDTERLALTNTGIIADLTRRLFLLENFIQTAMTGLNQGQAIPDVE